MTNTLVPTGNLLGAAQAEADTPMLSRAFVETGDFQALLFTSDFSYVVGRRGTGKSALFGRLAERFQQVEDVLLLVERPQDYEMLELQFLLESVSHEYRTLRPIMRLLWTVHFLLSGIRAATRHYRFSKVPDAQVLSEYLVTHSAKIPKTAIGEAIDTLKTIVRTNPSPAEIPSRIATHYDVGRITEALRRTLDAEGVRLVALYDRLDEAWQATAAPIAILGGLARAAAEYREKQFPIYPILFIRDNMFRALAQLDDDFTRHIEGHSLRLRWDEDSLFHLVAERLRVALDLEKPENETKIWARFAQRELSGRDGFAKCLRYTLYRPRDILVLLNEANGHARRDNREAIIGSDIEKSALQISQNRLEDLCKEYDQVLPGLRLFISSFLGQPACRPVAEVISQLDEAAAKSEYSDLASRDLVLFENGGEMLSALFSVGFIGVKDDATGNFRFCHDGAETALVSLPFTTPTLVHPCYWKSLDVSLESTPADTLLEVNDEYTPPPAEGVIALRLKRLGKLPEELSAIQEGHTDSRIFEQWVLRAVRVLFAGPLENVELHPNPADALNQRDVVARNEGTTPFWRNVLREYQSRQVIFECKNYAELKPEDFRQLLDYTSGEYGRFAIIVRRGVDAIAESEKARIRAMFHEHRRVVLLVPAPMLALCIRKLRTPKKYDYSEFTIAKHMDYLSRSVLSLAHAPRYKQKRRK